LRKSVTYLRNGSSFGRIWASISESEAEVVPKDIALTKTLIVELPLRKFFALDVIIFKILCGL
jgi:hypothetical protein